jgi:TRAP-type C4-dicarboxylate transport system substrate-binding protein
MKTFVTLLAATIVAAATALASTPADAQQKLVLKASDVHPAGYPTVVAVEDIGKKLEKATNGRLSVQMYPSMQLGGEKEAIEQAQVGAIAFARVSVGALGPVIDELNVFNLPYVFRNTTYAECDRRPDRPGSARQGNQQRQGLGRPCLDGCRRAQFLQHQEADQDHGRP